MATETINTTTGVVYLVGSIGSFTATGTITSTGVITEGGALDLRTVSTDGLVLQNTTAATAAQPVQISPRARLSGTAWNSTGLVSETNSFFVENLPATVAGTTTATWKLGYIAPGGTVTYPIDVFSNGRIAASSTSATVPQFTGPQAQGTGISFSPNANNIINFLVDNDVKWQINASGHLSANNDNVHDIGASGATRPKDMYLSGRYYLGGSGTATSTSKFVKKVTGIADNTATNVLTVTIPNGNHAAAIKLTFLSSNGSTDAFESSRVATGHVVVARTSGTNAVTTAATIDDAAIATVAAGATHTLAYNVSAIAGAADASNTFTVQVTIDDLGNLGSNQIVVVAEVINAEATGVTIA